MVVREGNFVFSSKSRCKDTGVCTKRSLQKLHIAWLSKENLFYQNVNAHDQDKPPERFFQLHPINFFR